MDSLNMVPTMWATMPHVNDVPPIGDNDSAILQEIRDVLAKHGALERFGVHLVHRHFGLQEGELLLETTDPETRRQTIEVKPAAEVLSGNVIVTQWVFDSREQVICRLYCDYRDYAHTNRHANIP